MSDNGFVLRMRELAIGEVGAAEAKSLIGEIVGHSPETAARKTYPALQEIAWRFIRARSAPEDLDDWIDVYRFSERLFEKKGLVDAARQIEVLGDMVARTARYADLQPPDSALGRRHVLPLLEHLARANGQMPRKELKRRLAVEEANLSRLISMLEAGGLLVRKTAGRESTIALTTEGRRAVPEPKPLQDVFSAVGAQLQSATGIAFTVTDEEHRLFYSENFDRVVGLPGAAATELSAAHLNAFDTDIQTDDSRWMRCIALPSEEGRSATMWVDVSDLKNAADRAEQAVTALEAELAAVQASRQALVAQQKEYWAFHSALGRRVGTRIFDLTRSAAIAGTPEAVASQATGFLKELAGVQSVVLDNPPYSITHNQPHGVSVQKVFDEVVALTSFFAKDKLMAVKSGPLPDLDIIPDNVIGAFKKWAAIGVEFKELSVKQRDNCFVFVGLPEGGHPFRSSKVSLWSCDFETWGTETGASIDDEEGELAPIEIVAPILGKFG